MIPKIIWQTHECRYDQLSTSFKKTSKSWINLNPGWQYNYMDSQERYMFVKETDTVLANDYIKLPRIIQADIWRYLVVYKYGGVYADLDSVCIKPLDYMLENIDDDYELLITQEKHDYINNANFAGIKECLPLYNTLNNIKNQDFINKKYEKCGSPHDHFVKEMNNNKKVVKKFSAAAHSSDFKLYFPTFDVDYYGKTISYNKLMESLNLEY